MSQYLAVGPPFSVRRRNMGADPGAVDPIVAADAVGSVARDRIHEVASDIEQGGAGAGRVFVYVGGLVSGYRSLSPLARPRGTPVQFHPQREM